MFKLIIGNMYSGKSSKLIELLDRYHIGKKKVILIRPKLDTRKYISRSKTIKYDYEITRNLNIKNIIVELVIISSSIVQLLQK